MLHPFPRCLHCLTITASLLLLLGGCHRQVPPESAPPAHAGFRLSNGIRVFTAPDPTSRTVALVCAFAGGVSDVPPHKAGLDQLTLDLMAMESQRYPDTARRQLLKQTAASISANADLDYATFSLVSIDTSFTQTFDLFADLLVHPRLSTALFAELRQNMQNQHRREMRDGYARASRTVNRVFFRQHPYRSHLRSVDSLAAISHDDVRAMHRRLCSARRMTLFVAGNIDREQLHRLLEDAFGSLPSGTAARTQVPAFAPRRQARVLLDPCDFLRPDVAYLRANLPAVAMTHPDYWPLTLACTILNDVLQNLIRTQHSLVYSVWAHTYRNRANYANLSAYRTSDPRRVAADARHCIATVAAGRCLSPYADATDQSPYIPIADALRYYKLSFATSHYSGLQTSGAIAAQMARAYILTGAPDTFRHVMTAIEPITAADIARVTQRYFVDQPLLWAVSAHPAMIEQIRCDPTAFAAEIEH